MSQAEYTNITNAPGTSPGLKFLDSPPPGCWFALAVLRKDGRKWDWVALMVDVDPDDLENCEFPALFYVHPKDYRPEGRIARQCWVLVPGKHRNEDAAWEAIQDLIETRH
jgi:hypothetical protein